MGKANRGGQKRKEAPARKQLQGRGGNSALLHKNNHKQHQHVAAGLDGGAAMGKRTLAQQLLQPNKQARGGKRRRKSDGAISKPRSSETAAIQAEYAAVDAREKAKEDADEARRLRAPVRIKLAPSTTALRMPSEGGASMASLRASSSARMVEALLQSITDDPAPDAPVSRRPVRSAGRKRKGNPYAALGNDDSEEEEEAAEESSSSSNGRRRTKTTAVAGNNNAFAGAWTGKQAGGGGGLMAFASPASFTGFSGGGAGSGGGSAATGVWPSGGGGTSAVTAVGENGAAQGIAVAGGVDDEDDDPDL